jgi:hypothetical protein
MHYLAWFLLAVAVAFLAVTLADRSLAGIGTSSADSDGSEVSDASGAGSGPDSAGSDPDSDSDTGSAPGSGRTSKGSTT